MTLRFYANSALFVFILACAGLSVLVYRQALGVQSFTTLFVVQGVAYPVMAMAAAVVLMKANLAVRTVIANCIVAAGVTVYAAEVSLGWSRLNVDAAGAAIEAAARKQGFAYDARSKIEVFEDLTTQGIDAYPFADGAMLVRAQPIPSLILNNKEMEIDGFPLAGRSKTTTILCNEAGRYVIYESDRYGFNNDDARWDVDGVDIAVVGDSLVHGACVDRGDNLVSAIGRRVSDVVNLGLSGNGPLLNLAVLREYAGLLRPKVVVWVHFEGNDMGNLRDEWAHPTLRRYITPDFAQGLATQQTVVDRYMKNMVVSLYNPEMSRPRDDGSAWRLPRLADVLLLREVRTRLRLFATNPYPEVSDAEYAILRQVLAAARETVAQLNGRLVFVFMPAKRHTDPYKRSYWERERAKVFRVVRDLGLTVIDLSEAVERLEDPDALYYTQFSHPNPDGYAFFADKIIAGIGI